MEEPKVEIDRLEEAKPEDPQKRLDEALESLTESKSKLAEPLPEIVLSEPEPVVEPDFNDKWLDISDILQRDNRKDPYLKACKTFSISPVSFLTQRLGQQEIVMRYHGLGIFGAQALAQVLQSNKTLIKLDLTGNYIERGGTHVCQAMTLNTTLTHLNLSFNKLGKSAQAIGNLLSENVALKTLILKGNDIGDMEATSIAEGLKQNVCLNVLDLSHNLIGDIGGIALGQAIAVNETLVEFDLGWNTIRQRGMMAFLTGVRDNTTIQHLNVQRNGIAESAPAVFALLQKNTTIAKLSIGYCRIDDQGMLAVAKGIETNKTLTEIDVSGNDISTQNALLLFKAVSQSKIQTLKMKHLRLSNEAIAKMDDLIREKTGIQVSA